MTGKIFAESANIHQDQAKILFDFYSRAAEKIVQEEERIEKQIAELEAKKAALNKEIGGLWVWFLTIILFFVYWIKKNALLKEIAEIDSRIAEFKKVHAEIFRDYRISKLGVAYVPVADQIKYEDKSFIVDYTGKTSDSEVTLQTSRQNDLLIQTIGELEQLTKEAPVIESSNETETVETDIYSTSIQEINEYDYFGKLDRSLKTLSYCMEDLDTSSVSLPLVPEASPYKAFLGEYATSEIPEKAPVIEVFDKQRYAPSVNKFQELNRLKDSLSSQTQQFEDVLKGLMNSIATSVQAISALKVASADKVVGDSNKILYQILKAPYNHYSPLLEHEEIERIRQEKFDYSEDVQNYQPFQLKQSSRVHYNLHTGEWVAEDGSTTNIPFGVHQIYEEIVAPVVQNLMEETRIERLKIYNHIKDQKISYLNKWHQDTEAFYRANRAESSDIINLMQESLREYISTYNTLVALQRTEDNMVESNSSLDATVVDVVDTASETLAAFELQSNEFKKTQSDFEEYMERLKEDIDLKAERFGHVEYYDAKLRDGHSNEVAVAADEVYTLDDRRKPLATVNPLFAKQSELLPSPNIEEITFEHISLNLPVMVKNALEQLDAVTPATPKAAPTAPKATVATPKPATPAVEKTEDEEVKEGIGAILAGLSAQHEETPQEAEVEEEAEMEEEYTEEEAATDEAYDEEADSDEEYDEEEEEYEDDEDLDEEDEDYDLTREELDELDDEELQGVMDELEIDYDPDNFDREAAINEILSYNE